MTVFEKRANPRVVGSTDSRSYNLTLPTLGLEASGLLDAEIRRSAQRVIGRRVFVRGETFDSPYGLRPNDGFWSIPRLALTLLQLQRAEELGVTVLFQHEVVGAEPDTGTLEWRQPSGSHLGSLTFDFICFADGVAGFGRSRTAARPGCSSVKLPETEYLKAVITSNSTLSAALPLDRISFWPTADGGPAVGIPNSDSTISLLVMGPLPGRFEEAPFSTVRAAETFLKSRLPMLIEAAPEVASQLVKARRGRFCYAVVTDWILGAKAVVIGDAARCAPPYSGAGGASAMNDAMTLVNFIRTAPDLESALATFQRNRRAASEVLRRMIAQHGHFLKTVLGSVKWRVQSRLQLLTEGFCGYRSLYQQVCFDPGGLNRLIERELGRREGSISSLMRDAASL